MPDTTAWISAIRSSHDRLTGLLSPLSDDEVQGPSYASEWSIADVASHLGSQAEIFELFLAAGLTGAPAPGGEAFQPIWDRWNALSPTEQVAQSIATNEAFVSRVEQIAPADAASFALSMFGMELDLAGFAAMRLGEHALHTWDVAVALDPTATVSADAVALLVDTIAPMAARSGKPQAGVEPIDIVTADPERHLVLTVQPEVSIAEGADPAADVLHLPAEAFVRLVYGRLDPDHTPADVADETRLATARAVFPGF
jgi:uncharacterized protein (TIGR03083 family)